LGDPLGESGPHLIRGSLGPPESSNGISIGSASLAQLMVLSNRHTEHAASVAVGYIFAIHACDVA